MKIAVIGQGYVGLPLAVRAAEVDHTVVGFDVDKTKVIEIVSGFSPIEDVSDYRLQSALTSQKYEPTSFEEDIADFDLAVITVPTPLDAEDEPDLSYVRSAAETVGRHLKAGATVILESTVAPGTTRNVVLPILMRESGLRQSEIHLAFSPERIDPGNPKWHFENTPKIVSGIDQSSVVRAMTFYGSMGVPVVTTQSLEAAELAKIIENTQRDVNIALVNEMTRYAHAFGIDIHDALRAAASKPYGYMAYQPGPGVGGHCLPIDPVYVASQARGAGVPLLSVELARRINNTQPDYVVERLIELAGEPRLRLMGKQIAVLGYSYKKGTSDARETPAKRVVERLLEESAKVTIFDPRATVPEGMKDHFHLEAVQAVPTDADLCAADAVVIITDHDEFDYHHLAEVSADTGLVVLDTRNRMAAYSSDRIEMI
jgi:UDP-N-acetyl-D-glucosamine dehydrogenase